METTAGLRGSPLKMTIEGPQPSHDRRRDGPSGSSHWLRWLRRVVEVAVLALAVGALLNRRHELGSASHLVSHLHWWWLGVAIGAVGASIVVFALLQRWLLAAGGVRVGLRSMVEITLAGNALGTTLPGGAAFSATWAFGQLRRRGADRVLSGWVILVAGALASFALFVLVAGGAFVAGSRGPVADLRPLAAALAAIPVAVGLGAVLLSRSAGLRSQSRRLLSVLEGRLPRTQPVFGAAGSLLARLQTVQPGPRGWLQAFGLALANWTWDAVALVACILAFGGGVPWRGVLVAYGLTQLAASIPITPGGIGVVEASLAALLVAYGLPMSEALAVTLLYRLVSFWGLAPIGWVTWAGIELTQRRGWRTRPHPWAVHLHGPSPGDPALTHSGPGRVLPPEPCFGCDEEETVLLPDHGAERAMERVP